MRTLLGVAFASLCLASAPPEPAPDPAQPNPIRLNQLGFLTDGPKRAMLADPSLAPLPWRLVDAGDRVAESGLTRVFGDDPASGEHVHQVDLGGLDAPGRYRLIVGGKESRWFPIGSGIYDRLRFSALNYFYQSRAGITIEARYAGGALWARPAGHLPEKATCISGADSFGNVWPACSYTLDVTGGWYDAGDQGKYVVNGGIALWTLLDLYERASRSGTPSPFRDGRAALPEAGNRVDDLLDEGRWEMEFLLKMQVPDGTRLRLPVGVKRDSPGLAFTEVDASGMAHHKVADREWTRLPTPPQDDPETRFLFPPSTGATLNLAATAAQCARIWRRIDAAFSRRCLATAERAWAAARRNPEIYAIAEFGGSGGYGDRDLSDEFYWAAAELFVTTGRGEYGEALRASAWFRAPPTEPSWGRVATLGTLSLLTAPNRLAPAELAMLRTNLLAAADSFLADEDRNGYSIPYAPAGYPWGSNSSILNRAILLARAFDLSGDRRYRAGVVDAIDYVLGRNPNDVSYVTGYGARPMQHPHHRFWARQLDPALPPPPPGVLSGGANSTFMSDPVARQLKGHCAPQKCWVDDIHAFSMNEVAINWNAPLVWVSAWLAERKTSGDEALNKD